MVHSLIYGKNFYKGVGLMNKVFETYVKLTILILRLSLFGIRDVHIFN